MTAPITPLAQDLLWSGVDTTPQVVGAVGTRLYVTHNAAEPPTFTLWRIDDEPVALSRWTAPASGFPFVSAKAANTSGVAAALMGDGHIIKLSVTGYELTPTVSTLAADFLGSVINMFVSEAGSEVVFEVWNDGTYVHAYDFDGNPRYNFLLYPNDNRTYGYVVAAPSDGRILAHNYSADAVDVPVVMTAPATGSGLTRSRVATLPIDLSGETVIDSSYAGTFVGGFSSPPVGESGTVTPAWDTGSALTNSDLGGSAVNIFGTNWQASTAVGTLAAPSGTSVTFNFSVTDAVWFGLDPHVTGSFTIDNSAAGGGKAALFDSTGSLMDDVYAGIPTVLIQDLYEVPTYCVARPGLVVALRPEAAGPGTLGWRALDCGGFVSWRDDWRIINTGWPAGQTVIASGWDGQLVVAPSGFPGE